MVIKRIGVLKLAIFQGAMGVAIGILAGLLFMLFGSMIAGLGNHGGASMLGGLAALILLPILYGVMGFIGGAVVGFVYNLIAGMVGGIEIEVE